MSDTSTPPHSVPQRPAVRVRALSWDGTSKEFDSWSAAREWTVEHLHAWTRRGDYIKSWPDMKGGQVFGVFIIGEGRTVAQVILSEVR